MKIAAIGTHGTGKSTLVSHLAALLKQKHRNKSVITLEENVRKIAKLTDNRLNTTLFQKLAISDQLYRELTTETIHDIIITDRTLLDYIIYGQVDGIKISDTYKTLAIEHMTTFDKVYFVRPDNLKSTIADDGFRDTNKTYRNQIDQEFETMILKHKISCSELKTNEILTHDYLEFLNVTV